MVSNAAPPRGGREGVLRGEEAIDALLERSRSVLASEAAFGAWLAAEAEGRLARDPEFQRAWMPDLATMGNVAEICGSRRRAL